MRLTTIWFTPDGILVKSTNAIGSWWWHDPEPRYVLDFLSDNELAAVRIYVTDRELIATTSSPMDD